MQKHKHKEPTLKLRGDGSLIRTAHTYHMHDCGTQHNTTQHSFDISSYPPYIQYSSDVDYYMEGKQLVVTSPQIFSLDGMATFSRGS